jgi:hydroxymethylpyrimidine/phosphomethylpyrimidine kinase
VVDVLAMQDGSQQQLRSPRIASRNVHGTGCTLSSAIAAHLALGLALPQAVAEARRFILAAITHGAEVQTGHGHGPLNHGHAPVSTRLLTLD